jgi:hypothetical protein
MSQAAPTKMAPSSGVAMEGERHWHLVMLKRGAYWSALALGEGKAPQIALVFQLARRN